MNMKKVFDDIKKVSPLFNDNMKKAVRSRARVDKVEDR